MKHRKTFIKMIHWIPRSKLVERVAEEWSFSDISRPLSMLSIAETFSLLECKTLSRLLSVPFPIVFVCESMLPDERDVPAAILALLSIATIAEVPYPGKFKVGVRDWVRGSCTDLSRSDGDAYLLCTPPSSSFISCQKWTKLFMDFIKAYKRCS